MSDNDNDNKLARGRTLGGGDAEPLPTSWVRPTQAPRVGRIGDWSGDSGPQSGHGPAPGDESDDDDDDPDKRERWFAGGERSGLSIENPNRPSRIPGGDMVRDLLRRAAEAGVPPVADNNTSTAFSGGGHRLGGEDVESAYVPNPNSPEEDETPVIRHLTFWREGFTVEDGELLRYDDPDNAQLLAQINAGRAPPSILDVLPNQRVEVRISKRTDESYVPPRGTKVFSGAGNRLGAPVPNISGTSSVSGSNSMPGGFPPSSTSPRTSISAAAPIAERESLNTRFEVDQTLPTTSVQIRLADGTRIVCRMNLTHKVSDLRNFINAARPENSTRSYTIGTTFPNRVLDDLDATIESAGLANSVVVQRWS